MKFELNKTVSYWVDGAKYDLDTAESLFQVGKYPYALFFGHLALEKLLKAVVVKETQEHAPYTHSLPLLVSKLKLKIPESVEQKFAEFMEFYIEARYPEEQKRFYKKCTKGFTEQKLKEIKKVFKWLNQRLEQS